MPFFSVPPQNSPQSPSEQKKSSYTTVASSPEPTAMSADDEKKDSRSLRRGLTKRAKKVGRFLSKRMGRHHREHGGETDTITENLSSLDVTNMTSTSSFQTTTSATTSSGRDSSQDENDDDDTRSRNTKDSKISMVDPYYKAPIIAEQQYGSNNHVDRHAAYGVSSTTTKQSDSEPTPPISPTSATAPVAIISPPNSCYSIDRKVDDAVVDELALAHHKSDTEQQPAAPPTAEKERPQIVVSTAHTEAVTRESPAPVVDHHQQLLPESSPVPAPAPEAKDAPPSLVSQEEIVAPPSTLDGTQAAETQEKRREEKIFDDQEEQEIHVPPAEKTTLQNIDSTIQERPALTAGQPESLAVIEEEKVPEQTQPVQEAYLILNDTAASDADDDDDMQHSEAAHETSAEDTSVTDGEKRHPPNQADDEKPSAAQEQGSAIPEEEQRSKATLTQEQPSEDKEIVHTFIPQETLLSSSHEEESVLDQDPESSRAEMQQQQQQQQLQQPVPAQAKAPVVPEVLKPEQPTEPLVETQDKGDEQNEEKKPQPEVFQSAVDEKASAAAADSITAVPLATLTTDNRTEESRSIDEDAVSKRVAYFDRKRSGRISMLDTFTSLQGLGYHWLVAIPATFVVHVRLSPLTMPPQHRVSMTDCLSLPIYTERVALALHTPVLAAQQQQLGQWVQRYGQRHGSVCGLGFWGGFRTLRAAESTSMHWWQLRLWMMHRLQWILTYTMLYDPSARMVTLPTLERLCNRQLPSSSPAASSLLSPD